MSDPSPEQLMAFLRTDARDVGCDEALRILSAYVELVIAASRYRGRTPRRATPAWRRTCRRVARAAPTTRVCSPPYGRWAVPRRTTPPDASPMGGRTFRPAYEPPPTVGRR